MVKKIRKARTVRRAKKKTSRGRKAQPAKAAKSRKLAREARPSPSAPEKGFVHYLLRNIPRGVWAKFLATRPDARFDLLTYITTEVEKSNGKMAEPETVSGAEPEVQIQVDQPVEAATETIETEPAINQ